MDKNNLNVVPMLHIKMFNVCADFSALTLKSVLPVTAMCIFCQFALHFKLQ